MKKFPEEFYDLLNAKGKAFIKGGKSFKQFRMDNSKTPYVDLEGFISKQKTKEIYERLHSIPKKYFKHVYGGFTHSKKQLSLNGFFPQNQRMDVLFDNVNQSEKFLRKIGLRAMLQSESFIEFISTVTGYEVFSHKTQLIQINRYYSGDYVGPHNDFYFDFEQEDKPRAYIDIHFSFVNEWVAQQQLIYQIGKYMSGVADIAKSGNISIYRLPFWHQTTPLVPKVGFEKKAIRYLLMTDLKIYGNSRDWRVKNLSSLK